MFFEALDADLEGDERGDNSSSESLRFLISVSLDFFGLLLQVFFGEGSSGWRSAEDVAGLGHVRKG